MVATFYQAKSVITIKYLIFLPHTVALLQIIERKKWNRNTKNCAMREAKPEPYNSFYLA